jgi:hypothetical protein
MVDERTNWEATLRMWWEELTFHNIGMVTVIILISWFLFGFVHG